MNRLDNIVGMKFNRLTVVEKFKLEKHVKYRCRCDCGNEMIAQAFSLKNGRTKSCGCYHKEILSKRTTTHGYSKPNKVTRIYKAWSSMKQRCYNPNTKWYHRYGVSI